MKQITHKAKVLWELCCEYSHIPEDVWYTHHVRRDYSIKDREGNYVPARYQPIKGKYTKKHSRMSKEQWDFVHSKYYYITKIDPFYSGSIKDFISCLEPITHWGRYCSRTSPYDYKKCNRKWTSYRDLCGGSYRRLPHHKKKELSLEQINKREWRTKKKDPRDQDKKRGYYGNKKPYVKAGNRAERRYIKTKLKSTRWTAYSNTVWYGENQKTPFYIPNEWDNYTNKKRRFWVDPWDWN